MLFVLYILVGEQHEQCACSGVPKELYLNYLLFIKAKSLIMREQKKTLWGWSGQVAYIRKFYIHIYFFLLPYHLDILSTCGVLYCTQMTELP